jgi:hypothetical protein
MDLTTKATSLVALRYVQRYIFLLLLLPPDSSDSPFPLAPLVFVLSPRSDDRFG